jgi:putative membrane protein
MEDYYEDKAETMILRDHLATDRTQLANERTLLAYYRTALTLFIAGATFVQFFHPLLMIVIGWIFIPLGFIVALIGWIRYHRMKQPLDRLRERAASSGGPQTSQADTDSHSA